MSNESNGHYKLKLVAKQFLESIGCQNIQMEYQLPKIQYTFGKKPRHWQTRQVYTLDVVGFKEGRLFAVECGGIHMRSLNNLAHQGVLLYILPFGKTKPFLWQRGIKFCSKCGNKI